MKTINIMTSCDGNLMKYIPVQLEAIADNLADRQINFYIFNAEKNNEYIDKLLQINYPNITVHDVKIKNPQTYELMAKHGGNWCGAAYYSFCAHEYLPTDMERIYYIDAGDILIIGNIDDYYFDDFEDKSIIATCANFKIEHDDLIIFNRDDISIRQYLDVIARGLFNSGSYVMNLDKIRHNHYTTSDFARLAELVSKIRGKIENAFFGDQGLLSLTYVGDIKYYNYPKFKSPLYMPYDFGVWYFDKCAEKLAYKPAVIHYIGDDLLKPWLYKYEKFLSRFQADHKLQSFDKLKAEQINYYNIWYEYALKADEHLKNFLNML